MKKVILIMLICLMMTACTQNPPEETMKETTNQPAYMNITQEEAKKIMDSQEGYVILDVREQDEFDAGHIPGAILIP